MYSDRFEQRMTSVLIWFWWGAPSERKNISAFYFKKKSEIWLKGSTIFSWNSEIVNIREKDGNTNLRLSLPAATSKSHFVRDWQRGHVLLPCIKLWVPEGLLSKHEKHLESEEIPWGFIIPPLKLQCTTEGRWTRQEPSGAAGSGVGQSWAGSQDWISTSTTCYPLRLGYWRSRNSKRES